MALRDQENFQYIPTVVMVNNELPRLCNSVALLNGDKFGRTGERTLRHMAIDMVQTNEMAFLDVEPVYIPLVLKIADQLPETCSNIYV